MKLKLGAIAASIITAGAFSAGAQAALLIDGFTAAQNLNDQAAASSNDSADSASGSVGPAADILGGYRHALLNATQNSSGQTKEAELTIGGGELSFSTESGLRGYTTILWNGSNSSAGRTGLAGTNLLQYGSSFNTETRANDLGFDFSITVWSANGTDSSTIFLPATVVQPYQNPGFPNSIPFAAFGLCGTFASCTGAGADFNNVGAIMLTLNWQNVANANGGIENLDLTIGPIRAVPEPSIAALLGVAGIAGGLAARRKGRREGSKA